MFRGVILALALLAGGSAAWMSLSLLGSRGQEADSASPEGVPTREVLVATLPVRRGEAVGPANLDWQSWPETAIADGLILRENAPEAIETYSGWISRAELLTGEPLRLARLAEGNAGLMALLLTPGMRAVAVRTSAESSAGGFILPNDRVDVLHTIMRDVDGDGKDEPVTLTIISNARTLAVDQLTEQAEGDVAKVGETVTLELAPEQVELLTSARNSGRISLALRAIADFGETELTDPALLAATQSAGWPPPAPTGLDSDGKEDSPGLLALLGLGDDSAAGEFEVTEPSAIPTEPAAGPVDPRENPLSDAATDPREPVRIRIIRSGRTETVVIDEN